MNQHMEFADEGLEVLSERECLQLLENARIGRVAAPAYESPITERRPQPLAAGHGQVSKRQQRPFEVLVHRSPPGPVGVEQGDDPLTDTGGDRGHERRGHCPPMIRHLREVMGHRANARIRRRPGQ